MPNFLYLYVSDVFSGIARGSYLACIGWTALLVTDDVGRVGQIVIVAMLTNILAGPIIGVLVDRQNRRNLVIGVNIGISLTMACLGLFWLKSGDPAILWLFVGVIVITALRLIHLISYDSLIKSSARADTLMTSVARFRTVHLLSTAIGMALAGAVMEVMSPSAGFVLSAVASGLVVAPIMMIKGVSSFESNFGIVGFIQDFRGGFDIFRTNVSVRLITLLAAVSLPVGQLVNAILSSLIRDDLGYGSAAFGIVDSAWAIGGICAAALLSLGFKFFSTRDLEYVFSAAAGGMTVCFALLTSVPALALLHGAMGFTVWLCRITIDGKILQECGEENVGRTKVYVEVVFSFSAILMCISPTLVELPKTADYFLFWGLAMVIATLALWLAKRSALKRS